MPRTQGAVMSEPTTMAKDGGFVSLERGPEEKDWNPDRGHHGRPDTGARRHPDVGRGGRARSSAATAGGRSGAVRVGRGRGARPGGFGLRRPLEVPAGRGDAEAGPTLTECGGFLGWRRGGDRLSGGCLRDGARSYAKTVKGTALPGRRRRPAGRDHQLPGSDPEPGLDAVAHR